MPHPLLLDCTLRDGGYVNDWRFGRRAIRDIAVRLARARVDIVECGFLRDVPYDENAAVFDDVGRIAPLIEPKRKGTRYVGMIAVGDIAPDKIAPRREDSIDGIRLTFHKHEWEETRAATLQLADKGYNVFIQPVGTTAYTDRQLLDLLESVVPLNPFAFYIVDTLGKLYPGELQRLFHLVVNNLPAGVAVGFHSHNNIQLSFANALTLINLPTRRHLILDASVLGMGRAAGNLCTELVAQYMNDNLRPCYDVLPLLEIADRHLATIHEHSSWGYALPYFLSAVDGIHPNYASYALNKKTLSMPGIAKLLERIPQGKRELYEQPLIEDLYLRHQDNEIDDAAARREIAAFFPGDRPVLLAAPGQSLNVHGKRIAAFFAAERPVVLSINFRPLAPTPDLVFVSNSRRYDSLPELGASDGPPVALTSNIRPDPAKRRPIMLNYSSLLGYKAEPDNAGLRVLRLLRGLGVTRVHLAGFDGFATDGGDDYYAEEFRNSIDRDVLIKRNEAIREELARLSVEMDLRFLTPSKLDPGVAGHASARHR